MDYILKKSTRAKTVRLSIQHGGVLVVTIPARLPKSFADQFVASKKDWIDKHLERQKTRPPKLLAAYSSQDFPLHKKNALAIVCKKIIHFNQFYKYKIGRIVIRDQTTRWGSCSSKGNLNFNYKIALLPSHLVDYIVVHELCHLGQMNHGPKFWDLVAEQIPDYKDRIRELKLY